MVANKLLVVLALMVSFVPFESSGQDYLNIEVYLKAGPARLDSILLAVTRQTGIVFSYNSKKINTRQKINVRVNTKSLSGFLDILKIDKGFIVKTIDNYVVISFPDNNRQSGNNQQSSISSIRQNNFKKPTASTPKPTTTTDSQQKDYVLITSKQDKIVSRTQEIMLPPINKKWSTIVEEAGQYRIKNIENKFALTVITSIRQVPRDTVHMVEPSRAPAPKKRFFIKQGLTVDESSFMGLALQIGLPSFYATFSGNSNLLTSHIRYGVGSSIKLTSKICLHITANNGSQERSGYFTDSLGNRFPIAVKSNLLRIGVGMEWRLKHKLTLQVIPIFNRLTTSYFINHVPSDLHLFESNGDRLFYNITAPYFLTNTFSPTSTSNTKTWIGLQLNLLYRINLN